MQACYGELCVTEQVVGYRQLQQFSDILLAEVPLDLPAHSFNTMGLWFDLPAEVMRAIDQQGLDLAGGIHAVEHAAIGILPLFAMCDRQDIGGLSTPLHPATGHAQVFIYDAMPGGMGITAQGFNLLTLLGKATLAAIRECPCESGCPSCIQSPKCGNNNEPLDKQAAIAILRLLLGEQRMQV